MLWNTVMSTLDHVPTFVWLIITFAVVGTVYYFFSPIITAIAAVTPTWVKVALGGLAALVLAFIYGRYRGAKTAQELEKQKQAAAVETRSKIDASTKNASDAELDERAGRWMRD